MGNHTKEQIPIGTRCGGFIILSERDGEGKTERGYKVKCVACGQILWKLQRRLKYNPAVDCGCSGVAKALTLAQFVRKWVRA